MNLLFNILNTTIKVPTFDSLGYSLDLYSPDNYLIKKDCIVNIPSGISLNIPEGYVGMLLPSGKLALNYNVTCPAGFIPYGYTKEITLSLHQPSIDVLHIDRNQHLAQIIFIPALNIKKIYGN